MSCYTYLDYRLLIVFDLGAGINIIIATNNVNASFELADYKAKLNKTLI